MISVYFLSLFVFYPYLQQSVEGETVQVHGSLESLQSVLCEQVSQLPDNQILDWTELKALVEMTN